ncbi:phosphatidylglycerophosphatase A [Legionella jamestowniensis]|uniref:Phosphatidylglycerophosphatase A n=1 Tax=Legionella jamestowniensis TaxID=455 RepID=A0A0W0UZW8_9GAMM|nr:phosphatidylglycerophosphatase A [Legionella jamestowniensis]KTD13388.1 phosphatidylglycerophosphatase A [Legionella jamestowniensis]OCH98411.1 phosphatidylglycerophosphatase [Legionella jamestowniensis]SFL76146.1 phosphatidylglycerophosphatase A [Legionella jamestowniensis DSM 19215]
MNAVKLENKVWQDPIYFIAFGFGSGLMPFAPGTWGTLAAIPVYLLLAGQPLAVYFTVTVLAFALGVWVSEKVSRDLGVHDYSGIVWDEVVGYLLTMIMAPQGIGWMVTGFILFRIFDIWKPQPIRFIDRHVRGGVGIMLDDVLAAIPAWFILQLLGWGLAL